MSKQKPTTFVCRWCHHVFPRPTEGSVVSIAGRAHCVPVHNEAEPTVEPVKPLDLDSLFSGVPDDKAA